MGWDGKGWGRMDGVGWVVNSQYTTSRNPGNTIHCSVFFVSPGECCAVQHYQRDWKYIASQAKDQNSKSEVWLILNIHSLSTILQSKKT
jgi:hypothetical protein